jgi:hypothetical protein
MKRQQKLDYLKGFHPDGELVKEKFDDGKEYFRYKAEKLKKWDPIGADEDCCLDDAVLFTKTFLNEKTQRG